MMAFNGIRSERGHRLLFFAAFMAGVLLIIVPVSIVAATIGIGQRTDMQYATKFSTRHLVGYLMWLFAAIPFVWFGLRMLALPTAVGFSALLRTVLPLMYTIEFNPNQSAQKPLLTGLRYRVKIFSAFIVAIGVFATFAINFLASPAAFDRRVVEAVS